MADSQDLKNNLVPLPFGEQQEPAGREGRRLFYRIGEAAKIAGVEPFVLRYWETEFPQIKPAKKSTGQRVYYEEDLKTILKIKKLLYEDGFTIAGARKALGNPDTVAKLEREEQQKIRDLKKFVRKHLRDVLTTIEKNDPALRK